MQRIPSTFLASALLGFAVFGLSPTVATAQSLPAVAELASHVCPSAAQVVVRAEAATDADAACEGADRALKFLSRAGLASPSNTTVEIVAQLPGELGGRAVGCYLRERKSIQLLTYEAFETGGHWFRVQVDRELYRSVAAHEMAHAVVGCNSEPLKLPVAAHEYVAYVVMFATMDPGLRERVLARFPGSGFTSILQINDITHVANPNQFGVDAWRHYLKRRDREG